MFLYSGALLYHIRDLPRLTQPFVRRLDSLRGSLIEAYLSAEKDLQNVKFDAPSYIYQLFYKCFWDLGIGAEADHLAVRDLV